MLITCRAVSRSFRFVPTPKVTETLRFCFAYVLSKFDISVHEFVWMSNHFHIVLTTPDACLPAFMQELNSLCSRALNALRGWTGSNIEKGYNITVDTDEEAILHHCAYTLANPCAADLVMRAEQWKGVTSIHLEYGQEIEVERPKYGLWAPSLPGTKKARLRKQSRARARRTVTPQRVTISLSRPPVARGRMSDAEVRAEVRRRLVELESQAEAARAEAGKRVLGMRRVREQSWFGIPREPDDMFESEPTVAGSDKGARALATRSLLAFRKAYAAARDAWIGGQRDALFPFGTWLMRRRFAVRCATSPPT
jgi:putative transposase